MHDELRVEDEKEPKDLAEHVQPLVDAKTEPTLVFAPVNEAMQGRLRQPQPG